VLGDEQYQGMVAVWDLLNHITGRVNVRLHHDADKGVLQVRAWMAGVWGVVAVLLRLGVRHTLVCHTQQPAL
jgi:hypothetical protein